MRPMLNIAIQAIRKAGNFIIKQYELCHHNNINSDYINNFIYNINKESDRIIIKIIKKFYPLHVIVTQNSNFCLSKKNNIDNNVHWIIGPIENGIHFIKQFPFLSLSIAVKFKDYIEIGVIYDPIHNELFSACRGEGAQLNGYRIRVSSAKNLQERTILAISLPYNKSHIAINLINKLYNKNIDFRCIGTISLDLAYVAVGRIDGCFGIFMKKNKQLLASGSIIIRESGGIITDFTGTNNYLLSGNIIAGNPKIIRSIYHLLN